MNILKKDNLKIKDFKAITVAIDNLDDIFTDFDPRPVEQRALSEDFLQEIKKFYREGASGQLTINFLAPIKLQKHLLKNRLDLAIVNHIKQIFKHKVLINKKILRQEQKRGLFFLIFGIIFLLIITLFGYYKTLDNLTFDLLGVVFIPLGWFGIWEGFSKVIDNPIKLQEETKMFEKLAKAHYTFKYLSDN